MAFPDVLGGDWVAETCALRPERHDPAPVATLVHRPLPGARGAMLWLPGYHDTFFHTELADTVAAWGWRTFALDWRRHGRSIRPGAPSGFADDLDVYFEEIGWALRRVREEGLTEVWICAHSTGGLVACRYVAEHPQAVSALVLDAPFLDLPPLPFPGLTRALLRRVGARSPMWSVRAPVPFHGWSVHAPTPEVSRGRGEWHYDVAWKPLRSPFYAGWFLAVERAWEALDAGPGVDVPVLTLVSSASHRPLVWSEACMRSDVVLDVHRVARAAARLGPHVRIEYVRDALHDVFLSRADVRQTAYGVLGAWLEGLDGP